MNNESSVIPAISCGPVSDSFIEANLWISTGDTNSKIHKDSNNQMNCLYKGTKTWTMFAPEHSKSMYLVNERPGEDQMYDSAGFSRINTRNVNLNKFPKFAAVPFHRVTVNAGDCLYVPGTYMHHVYSSGERNIQVSLLFSGPEIPTAMMRVYKKKIGGKLFKDIKAGPGEKKCSLTPTSMPISDADVAWPYDGTGPITMGFNNPSDWFRDWRSSVKKAVKKANGKLSEDNFVRSFLEFVKTLDRCDAPRFDQSGEIRRHVFEALDILFPEWSGRHDHWNATGHQGWSIPNLCSILLDAVAAQASRLFKKTAILKHGSPNTEEAGLILDHDKFKLYPRKVLQGAMNSTFVWDQITAVAEEVSNDYGTAGSDDNDEREDPDDDDGGDEVNQGYDDDL